MEARARRPPAGVLRAGVRRARGRARAGQGRHRLRRRLGPRADARRLRRAGHARRRVPGRGLHLADARPDARGHQGRRRRRRRPAHRQELHGRRPELRDGRRPREGRGHRGRGRRHQRRRGGRGLASTPRAAAASAPPCWPRRSAAPPPRQGSRSPRWPSSAGASTAEARSMGMALTACTTPVLGQADLRAARRRDGDRHRHPRRAGPLPRAARPRRARGRAPGHRGRRGPPVRLGRPGAGLRQRHGRHAADRALHRLPRAAALPRGARHHASSAT